jgi:signal recognition particle receptor subunit beta
MADNSTSFKFGEILSATRRLHQDLRAATQRSDDFQVNALTRELDEVRFAGAASDAPPLTIVFVGQYDAGKSTSLSVLTGCEDIVIDADVSTSSVTTYDWNGVSLLDTPGIHAGHPEHDEQTYAAIARADLLVFVVTNELFDDTIGHHFRELAFQRQYARRMLLVVNKMNQDDGSPETKRPGIEQVTAPFALEDFRGVFIDARSWLEAQDADDEDRADLLEIANIGALTVALNAFIAGRGLAGRLSAPLFTMRGVAEQASALLATDFPLERAALELLHRKRSLLLASRARLRTAMGGVIARAVADIGTYGDEVAEAIEPGKSEAELNALNTTAQARADASSAALSEEAQRCVEAELAEVQRQLEALQNSVLARELVAQLETGAPGNAAFGDYASPAWAAGKQTKGPADWPAMTGKVGNAARKIGHFAARWATGPAAAEGASVFSVTAARGSDAHKVVYDVGKFFGVKFKPWGAVKIARTLGNAGRVISAIGGVLGVVAQIVEDHQQNQHRLQLRDARDGLRSAYTDAALAIQAAFWEQFEAFLADFYDSELQAIDDTVEGLVSKRGERKSGAHAFTALHRRATALIQQVSTHKRATSAS